MLVVPSPRKAVVVKASQSCDSEGASSLWNGFCSWLNAGWVSAVSGSSVRLTRSASSKGNSSSLSKSAS